MIGPKTNMHTYAHTYMNAYKGVLKHEYIRTNMHTYAHTYMNAYIRVLKHEYIRTNMHKYVHTLNFRGPRCIVVAIPTPREGTENGQVLERVKKRKRPLTWLKNR